jgi:hypothetical protein
MPARRTDGSQRGRIPAWSADIACYRSPANAFDLRRRNRHDKLRHYLPFRYMPFHDMPRRYMPFR